MQLFRTLVWTICWRIRWRPNFVHDTETGEVTRIPCFKCSARFVSISQLVTMTLKYTA